MRDAGLIDDRTLATNKARELGVITVKSRRATYYPSFMDLVRRQLARDYEDRELEERGLKIYTTLDPATQAAAEEALVAELRRLQPTAQRSKGRSWSRARRRPKCARSSAVSRSGSTVSTAHSTQNGRSAR